MTDSPPIYVVDDDAAMRNSLRFLLTNAGRKVTGFESGEALLGCHEELEPGPTLLDIRLTGMSGLEVMAELSRRQSALPLIMITGHGDISMAVKAMQAGAVDFLTKPFAREDLMAALSQADARIASRDAQAIQRSSALDQLKALTDREFGVVNELARGLPNKSIGYDFGISSRTVEIHRANAMKKLAAHNFPDLLRIAFAAGMPFDDPTNRQAEEQRALPLDVQSTGEPLLKHPTGQSTTE